MPLEERHTPYARYLFILVYAMDHIGGVLLPEVKTPQRAVKSPGLPTNILSIEKT